MIWVANLLGSSCNYWTKKQKTGTNWLRGKTEKRFYYFCKMTNLVTSLSSAMLIYIIRERERASQHDTVFIFPFASLRDVPAAEGSSSPEMASSTFFCSSIIISWVFVLVCELMFGVFVFFIFCRWKLWKEM